MFGDASLLNNDVSKWDVRMGCMSGDLRMGMELSA